MGATAFQKGLGAMHSLSHPCCANLNTHHGLTNAVVMPYVLAWNRSALERKDAAAGGVPGPAEHSFDGVLDWILELRSTIGIPDTLAELGVTCRACWRLRRRRSTIRPPAAIRCR